MSSVKWAVGYVELMTVVSVGLQGIQSIEYMKAAMQR